MAAKKATRRGTGKGAAAGIKLAVKRRRLANGLTLLAARSRAAPTLALLCSFEVNQINEAAKESGIAHLVGETLDEGTEKWSGAELAELVEGLGGSLRTGGNGVSIHMAAEDAKMAVRILGEVVMRPTFPTAAVRRAKQLTVADIQSDLDDPRIVAGQRFRELVYGDHPFARQGKGSLETIKKLTRAKLTSFHKRWFVPDNAMIAAVGDIEPSEILDMLEKEFRGWRGARPDLPDTDEPALPKKSVREHIKQAERQQVQVYLGHIGVRRTDPDFYKLLVMDHVLGTGPGFTSRIARTLRDEQGLCYSVGAGITASAGREPGMFTAYMSTSPKNDTKAVNGFLKEMNAIRDTRPAEDEMRDVKAYLTGSFVWALERNANLASFLLRAERFDLGDDYVDEFPKLIEAVSAADVQECAARHLDPKRYYLVTLGPA